MRESGPPLKLFLLGRFRVERTAQTICLPTRKVESLLAFLALHPEPHPREKIAALFWGDVTDAQAAGSLRKALTLLRQHLGGEILIADRKTIQRNPDLAWWCDAHEFQQQASEFLSAYPVDPGRVNIELYHGDLLEDWYDDWITFKRERYRALYLETLLQLTQAMRARSEYPRAIQLAQKVLTLDAANESAHQHLMFCYWAMGKRCEALQQYHACQRALNTELGVSPISETTALFERMRQTPAVSASATALMTNLPIPISSFVGRKQELADVKGLLHSAGTRLLTLTGTGGCGKTRLAIQSATDLVDAFNDGVWWVDFAPLLDTALVLPSVAKVWNLREEQNHSLLKVLANYLYSKQLLLVLDNCEHLLEACAQWVDELLKTCPTLKIMTTSRESLGLTGETIYRVPSLALPDGGRSSLAAMASCESVQLFAARAATINPHFTLHEQNGWAVARICQQLDGIPLAIELAAAWARVLTPDEILARLEDRFAWLTQGSRTALPRQQTLRATLDWSYDTLSAAEANLFRRLAVFVGGFTLKAAEQICAEEAHPSNIFGLLTRLIEKSLVAVTAHNDSACYLMLETIRHYADEKLLASGEDVPMRNRHANFFLALAEEAAPKLAGGEPEVWLARLGIEHDNLRAAIDWLTQYGDTEMALRLGGALWRFWERRGYLSEGLGQLTKLLSLPVTSLHPKTRLKALYAAGVMADAQGNYALARTLFEEHLAINRELQDHWGIASALNNLGIIALREQDYATARTLFMEVLDIWRKIKYQPNIALTLSNLGNVAHLQGDANTACTLYTESLDIFQKLGDRRGVALAHNHLGDVAREQRDWTEARARYETSLTILKSLGDQWGIARTLADLGDTTAEQNDFALARHLYEESIRIFGNLEDQRGIVHLLRSLAGLFVRQGHHQLALRLAGAAAALGETLGVRSQPEAELEHHLALARQTLGKDASQSEWERGAVMPVKQAIADALYKTD